jgi:hypothetical protein
MRDPFSPPYTTPPPSPTSQHHTHHTPAAARRAENSDKSGDQPEERTAVLHCPLPPPHRRSPAAPTPSTPTPLLKETTIAAERRRSRPLEQRQDPLERPPCARSQPTQTPKKETSPCDPLPCVPPHPPLGTPPRQPTPPRVITPTPQDPLHSPATRLVCRERRPELFFLRPLRPVGLSLSDPRSRRTQPTIENATHATTPPPAQVSIERESARPTSKAKEKTTPPKPPQQTPRKTKNAAAQAA